MRTTSIKIPIYFGRLVIIQTNDFKSLDKKFDIDVDDNQFEAFVFYKEIDEVDCYHIVMKEGDVRLSVIAHECVHLANEVFIKIRAKLDPYNDEPHAYLVGWFFTEIEN